LALQSSTYCDAPNTLEELTELPDPIPVGIGLVAPNKCCPHPYEPLPQSQASNHYGGRVSGTNPTEGAYSTPAVRMYIG